MERSGSRTMPSGARSFWMIVTSPANYERTKLLRFRQQGMKKRHLRKAERMAPGDGMSWYVTGHQTFAAIATLTSPYFESAKPIWVSDGAPDIYPWGRAHQEGEGARAGRSAAAPRRCRH